MSQQIHSIDNILVWQIYLVIGIFLLTNTMATGCLLLGLAVLNYLVAGKNRN